MKKKQKIREGLRFYPVRTIRVSDDVWEKIKAKKKGTWNFFMKSLIEKYAKD